MNKVMSAQDILTSVEQYVCSRMDKLRYAMTDEFNWNGETPRYRELGAQFDVLLGVFNRLKYPEKEEL